MSMTKMLSLRSVLLLLFVHFVLTVNSYGAYGHRPRRERSSYYGSSSTRADRTNFQESRPYNGPTTNVQQQYKEPSTRQEDLSVRNLNERLQTIFAIPDRDDVNWINSTFGYALSDGNTSSPQFTVQRSPDGKLGVVYNEFLILQTPAGRHNTPPTASSAIVFSSHDVDDCAEGKKGKTYCVSVPDYEEKTQLNKVSKEEFDKFSELFVEDVIEPFDIKNRMNGNPQDIELCTSSSKVVYPKKGQTKDSEWKYLVQTADRKQGVLEETCDKEGQPCEFAEFFLPSYTSRCKQYHSYKLMVAIENGTLSRKEFLVGAACKCVLRQNT